MLDLFRLRRIFNPSPLPDPNRPSIVTFNGDRIYLDGEQERMTESPSFSKERKMSMEQGMDDSAFPQPQRGASERFLAALGEMPQRQNPNMLRKIAAGIASISPAGRQMQEDILYPGYKQKVQDWNLRMRPLSELADIERSENQFNRQIWSTEQQNKRAADTLERQREADRVRERQGDERLRQGEERIAIAETNAKTAQERARIYAEVSKGGVVRETRDGSLVIVKRDGTVIPTSAQALSFEDKLELQNAGRLQIESALQGNREQLENLRHENDLKEIVERARTRAEVGESETQKSAGEERRARELLSTRPEMKDVIEVTGNNFKLKEPKSYLGGLIGGDIESKKKLYQEAVEFIYKKEGSTSQAPKAPPGWKYVPKAGGGWTAVEDK